MAEAQSLSNKLKEIFDQIDHNGDGHLNTEELRNGLLNAKVADDATVEAILLEADYNNDGSVDKSEFLKAMKRADKKGSNQALHKLVVGTADLLQIKFSSGGIHSYSQEEVTAFADHINNVLGNDKQLADKLPLDIETDDLMHKVSDGILLAKFINIIKKDTIDMRAINFPKKGKPLSIFKVNENLNLAINSAKGIGVRVTNVGAGDLREYKNPALILGLMWQMVKMQLLSSINLTAHPELIRLLMEGETLEDFLKLSPENILKRWMNYHLREAAIEEGKDASQAKQIRNFGGDVKDSEAYTIVMNRIDPTHCSKAPLNEKNKSKRADMVLNNARSMGIRPFVKARDISSGNEKLNLAFAADLFNHCPGLDPPDDEASMAMLGMMDDDEGDNREERVFRMWANCLGIDDFYLNNLFSDFETGVNLLKIIDAVEPGIVKWKKVEKPKPGKKFRVFSKNNNNDYAVVLGKQLKFSLVGIGGSDVTNGNKKLILAFVWQLFRHHSLKMLREVSNSPNVDEKAILEFANNNATQTPPGPSGISSFKDKENLSTGKFLACLAGSLKPDSVDWDLVTDGANAEDAFMNCRYAISIARKLGSLVFCLPEDLQEVKPKMVMTFCASIMHTNQKGIKISN